MSPNTASDAHDDEVTLLTPWQVSRMPALLEAGDGVCDSFRLLGVVQLLKAFALASTEGFE